MMFYTVAIPVILGFFLWRFASNFIIIPWPYWLSWMLENPYMLLVSNSKKITSHLQLKPGYKVADLGCGAGRISIPCAQIVTESGEVHAYDIQKNMLLKTQKRAEKYKINNIKYIKSELKMDIMPVSYYDRCVMVTVLGEVPNRLAILNEIFKSLKSGGILSITEVIPDPCYITKNQLQKMCHEIGFNHSQTWKSPLAYTMNFSKP